MIERTKQLILDWWRGYGLLGAARASDWASWRKQHIKTLCDGCGKKAVFLKPLELHHLEPFHLAPQREKDPTNVATVCRRCHQLICHLDNFKSYNINAKMDLAELLEKIKNRP